MHDLKYLGGREDITMKLQMKRKSTLNIGGEENL